MQMNNPIGITPLDDTPDGIVGKPMDRVDGPLKVAGRAVYAYEVEQGPNTAYGHVVQASIGKGRISSIDSAVAEPVRPPGRITAGAYQCSGRFRTGVRRGTSAGRRYLHDAIAEPDDDGAACHARDMGRR
jgi:hypothetical protein